MRGWLPEVLDESGPVRADCRRRRGCAGDRAAPPELRRDAPEVDARSAFHRYVGAAGLEDAIEWQPFDLYSKKAQDEAFAKWDQAAVMPAFRKVLLG